MAAAAAPHASAAIPHFCFYHAQKESQSQAAEKLAKDLAYFFSGDYLSAYDLNTALGRLIPAVIRGEIKPRVARTVAYMLQTLLQSTHLAQHEYINAFSTDGWRDAVRTSVNANHDHLFPPDPDDVPDPEAEPEPQPTPDRLSPGRTQTEQPQQASSASGHRTTPHVRNSSAPATTTAAKYGSPLAFRQPKPPSPQPVTVPSPPQSNSPAAPLRNPNRPTPHRDPSTSTSPTPASA